MIKENNVFEAYQAVAMEWARKINAYNRFKERNPDENVSEEEWIIGTLITDLLVAKGELDPIYIDRYNY